MKTDYTKYETRLSRPPAAKLPELQREKRLKHIIYPEQFNTKILTSLTRTADKLKEMSLDIKTSNEISQLLSHKRAVLYFTQASTRTYMSFLSACQLLGISTADIRDSQFSSEYKGESKFDSIRMLSTYFDLVIMRDTEKDIAESCAYMMNDLESFNQRNVPIINGGSGKDEHPTQALLDIYTLMDAFNFTDLEDSSTNTRFNKLRSKYRDLKKGLEGKTFVFVGDIGRGRTVKSLVKLLAQYKGGRYIFISPPHEKLRLPAKYRLDLEQRLGVYVEETDELTPEILGEADALYLTRIQNEHDDKDLTKFYQSIDMTKYHITENTLTHMKEYAVILHPLPRNNEIHTDVDKDPRAYYFKQARNGMWIRAALIAYLFDADMELYDIYENYRNY